MEEAPSNIVHLVTPVGQGYEAEADAILDSAKAKLRTVMVIGWEHDGSLYVRSSHGDAEQALLLNITSAALAKAYLDEAED